MTLLITYKEVVSKILRGILGLKVIRPDYLT